MYKHIYIYLRQPRCLHIGEEQDVADDEEREDAEDGERVEHPHAVVVLRPGEPRFLPMSRSDHIVGWAIK